MTITRYPSLAHWGAFTAVVEDGKLIDCEPFAHDPQPSPMLKTIASMVYGDTRIRAPYVREGWLKHRDRNRGGGDRFIEVPWDEALTLVADELARLRATHGPSAVFGGSYGWSSAGRLHHARTLIRRFLFSSGGCVDQLANYSYGAAMFLLPHVIGSYDPVSKSTDWASLVGHTKLFVAFGGLALKNTQVTSGGAGQHMMTTWLKRAADAGVEFVIVSPTRADAPAIVKPRWIPIRPNTDTAFMLAMAHVLVSENRHDAAFLASHCVGFDRFRPYLMGENDGVPKSPEWAAAITGVPADTIRELARQCASTRSFITTAWSLQRSRYGEQPFWMAIVLSAMLGQVGMPGGGFGFGHGSMNGVGNPRLDVPAPEVPMGVNPAKSSIPVARIADCLLMPGAEYDFNGARRKYPDVRLVYWAGGNPFHHHQDLNRLNAAWQRPETVIVHESQWTPTARRGDIVLPATMMVERNDVGGSSRDDFVLAMHRAIDPVGKARNDFDIFRELAARLGTEQAFTEGRGEQAWLQHIYAGVRKGAEKSGVALPPFEEFWAQGYARLPEPKTSFVLYDEFRADPASNPLATPSGRIEIFSERIAAFGYDDCPPHPTWLARPEWLGGQGAASYPLHLISNQPYDRLHSQGDAGVVAQAHKVAGRERIRIHPEDARARGIAAGDVVRVFNDRGACLAGAVIDDGVMRGVAIMSMGAWFDPSVAGDLDRAGNANVLTPDVGTSRLAQGSSAQSALVEIERFCADVPSVEVYSAPAAA